MSLQARHKAQTAKAAAALLEAAAAETELQLVLAVKNSSSSSNRSGRSKPDQLERDLSVMLDGTPSPAPIKPKGSSVTGIESPRSNVNDNAADPTTLL